MADEDRRLEVYPPIYRLGAVGKWLRGQFMIGILAGTPVLLRMERLRSGWLNKVMTVVSFMGEEEFYTIMPPMVVWVWDARLGRLLSLLMALAFYVTGFLKNMLCLPRPPSPPVVPLHVCQDWSLPSHHAVLSASLPWYLWFYSALHYRIYVSHTYLGVALFLGIAMWSFCVMFSRMYLGVHSPADILAGGVVGCMLLAAWLQLDLAVDHFLRVSANGMLLYVPIAVVMLYLHPDPKPTTIIYKDTVTLVGVVGGVILTYSLFPTRIPALLESSQGGGVWMTVGNSVARYLLGMLIVVLVKTVTTVIIRELLSQLCRLVVSNVVCRRRVSVVTGKRIHYSPHFITLEQPRLHSSKTPDDCSEDDRTALDIAVPVRLITYIAISATVCGGVPYVFSVLGM